MTSEVNREALVLETIREIEKPFLEALKRAYGKKQGWRVCGPASVALTRILATLTGIPIEPNGQGEHFELTIGIYDPVDQPDRLNRIEEQTYVLYLPGNRFAYYIDPIFGLLMQGQGVSAGAIKVEKYHRDDLATELTGNHHIYPFSPEHEGINQSRSIFRFFPTPQKRMLAWQEMVSALHDERATVPAYALSTGHVFKIGGIELVDIIRQFAPAWTPDIQEARQIMRRVVMIMYPGLGQPKVDDSRSKENLFKNIIIENIIKINDLNESNLSNLGQLGQPGGCPDRQPREFPIHIVRFF